MVSSASIVLCLDARILAEYTEVLVRPRFAFDPDAVSALIAFVAVRGEMVASIPLADPLPDPDDQAFLEVAIAAGSVPLVTGNVGHFPADRRQGVPVLTPKAFLEEVRDSFPPS